MVPEGRFTNLDGRSTSLLLRHLMPILVTLPKNEQNKTPGPLSVAPLVGAPSYSPKGGGLIPSQGT